MEIIVKTIFGSHLYGTNTETSDIDYKIIYKDSLADIILKKPVENKRTRAEDKTEEAEYIELRKFLKDLSEGQTYAVDMIFTPKDKILQTSETWELIRQNKKNLLSKDCKAFIGYCVTQAKLYRDKGERIRELLKVEEEIKDLDNYSKVGDQLKSLPLIQKEATRNNQIMIDNFYELHGKYYSPDMLVKELKQRIAQGLQKYGRRANEAGLNIRDWKSIYHAFRTIRELRELAQTGSIKFPLSCADELLQIRRGEWPDYKDERLEWELNSAIADVRATPHLRDVIDLEWLNNFILEQYL
jgi:hypothetical protein